MKRTLVIFKKEFLDTLRDRRTIMLMIVLPLLVFPLLMGVVTKIAISQSKKAQEKVLKVGLLLNGNASAFSDIIKKRTDMTVAESLGQEDTETVIKNGTFDFVVAFQSDFDLTTNQKKSGVVTLHYRSSSEMDIAKRRLDDVLSQYKAQLLDTRLKDLNLEKEFVDPMTVNIIDIATMKEQFGEKAGGFIPYIFIIFCFVGAMYPAIDLAAGEKERSTIETLLTSPASRMEIVLGKFLVITLAGLISASVSIVGLFIAVKQAVKIPDEILDALIKIIEPSTILMVLTLLIPLCVLFAALLLSFSVYAKSFKEAQSIMTPMNFIVILPAIVGTLPGIKLTFLTAVIPIFNVSLATKEIISGTIQTPMLMLVYLSSFTFAGLSLFFCARWFNREEVIFRGI